MGKHNGISMPDCQHSLLYGKGFAIRVFGGCIFVSTVIYRGSTGYCMFIVALLYGCPSYYFLLVRVLILHICKQLCSFAAVVLQRPYCIFMLRENSTGYHHKRIIVVPEKTGSGVIGFLQCLELNEFNAFLLT